MSNQEYNGMFMTTLSQLQMKNRKLSCLKLIIRMCCFYDNEISTPFILVNEIGGASSDSGSDRIGTTSR